MPYEPKNFEGILGTPGLSDTLLKNHFTLYQGYVTNTNKLWDEMVALMKDGKIGTPEFAESKRRFGWEFDGMRLHELYFGNITKAGAKADAAVKLMKKITEDFGSYANWEADFKAVGAMRGIGWAVLYYDFMGKRLFNCWINEHDAGHLATCVPVLIMDVFEHAWMPDYGLKRADYIGAFMKAIDWKAAEMRFGMASPVK